MKTITIILALATSSLAAAQFATQVTGASADLTGSGLYNSPQAALGSPTRWYDAFGTAARTTPIESAFNVGLGGEKLLVTLNVGSFIELRFDAPVTDDPLNPYGQDFLVFGNAFYFGDPWPFDNYNTTMVTGGPLEEPVRVSVSQDGVNWTAFAQGPYGDTAFPTNAFAWDRASASWTNQESDFTKPVNPALAATFASGGMTAADVIDAYDGSGGGTGFDLAAVGLPWIQYVRIEGGAGFAGGEIDAVADVSAVPEPATMLALGAGLLALARRRRNQR